MDRSMDLRHISHHLYFFSSPDFASFQSETKSCSMGLQMTVTLSRETDKVLIIGWPIMTYRHKCRTIRYPFHEDLDRSSLSFIQSLWVRPSSCHREPLSHLIHTGIPRMVSVGWKGSLGSLYALIALSFLASFYNMLWFIISDYKETQ